jgi:hypothetical protein
MTIEMCLLALLASTMESSAVNWTKRNVERIRLDIIKDLIKLDLLRCKPISQQRHTRPLAEVWQDVANAETVSTVTMKTEAH